MSLKIGVDYERRKQNQPTIMDAEANIGAGNYKEAQSLLFQVWGMAKQTPDPALTGRIIDLCGRVGLLLIPIQSVEISPLETKGLILDIGAEEKE